MTSPPRTIPAQRTALLRRGCRVVLLVGPVALLLGLLRSRLAQLVEVRASRARIVEAADAARRQVERDLHDGAQQHLVSLALTLRLARGRLSGAARDEVGPLLQDAGAELADALQELRELARGIYPVLLTDAGLGPALTALAERSAVPVVLAATPVRRFPGPVERACYFVVSEALTNAVEHASADEIGVRVREQGGTVSVEVCDDGTGGADPRGSGLRGLEDRVAACGGRLTVVSPAGGGTLVRADLPCG